MTRISTAHAYDLTITRLSQRQRELVDTQSHISSNKRVLRASDDPVAAARAERALATIARSEAGLRSVDASRNAMTQAESALGEAVELLQRAREALVAGGDASYDEPQRKALAGQIRDLRAQLLGVANRSDGAGGWLFSGQGSSTPPFVDAAGGVRYNGTPGSALAGAGLPMTLDGAAAWLTAPSGNGVFETRAVGATASAWIDAGQVTDPAALTGSSYRIEFEVAGSVTTYSVFENGAPTPLAGVAYVAGQAIEFDGLAVTVKGAPAAGDAFEIVPSTPTLGVFDMLDRAADELETPLRSPGQMAQATATGLRDIDALLARIGATRSGAGEALHAIDAAEGRLAEAGYQGEVERSAAEDLDLVSALSDLQSQQTAYETALQAYASVQRLSLFDYIR
ncbi:MAG: flagellar hook-associated protein FlgL [Ideonella sp.]|nr:flagellar hook-associated protein FlgL [Ideonella sp.]